MWCNLNWGIRTALIDFLYLFVLILLELHMVWLGAGHASIWVVVVRGGGVDVLEVLRTYFFEKTPGIFRFSTLPLEIPGKTRLHI